MAHELFTPIRAVRFTSKFHNTGKQDLLKRVFEDTRTLKNHYSKFIYDHQVDLWQGMSAMAFTTTWFKNCNAQYSSNYLTYWCCQKLFLDIVTFYLTSIKQIKQKLKLQISTSNPSVTYYKKSTKFHNKGEIKNWKQAKKNTNLSNLIKYLIFCKLDQMDLLKDDIALQFEYYCSKFSKTRILNLVASINKRLIKKLRLIEFKTGSFVISSHFRGRLFRDDTNTRYKYWIKIPLKDRRKIYLPLQINPKYHTFDKLRESCWIIKDCLDSKKVTIIAFKDVDQPRFKEFINNDYVLGGDLNAKHNLIQLSDGSCFDYNRSYINKLSKLLLKFDKIETLSKGQRRRLQKAVRTNTEYFKYLVHKVIVYLEEHQITDLVLEDLAKFNATFVKDTSTGLKFSRLVRVLRLSNIKNWFIKQAEKRGIRVHLTPAYYSSQQCPVCGYINKKNRKTQEQFACMCCGHCCNADLNAAVNLKFRFTNVLLNRSLHEIDWADRLVPKKLSKFTIKSKLLQAFD